MFLKMGIFTSFSLVILTIAAGCRRTYRLRSATFSSSSYMKLNGSQSTEKCEWHIKARPGEQIVLNISDLDIERSPNCTTDYVEVKDGFWHESLSMGKYCGTGKMDLLTSTGPNMLISLVMNNPGHRGFLASYEAICGDDLFVDREFHLESPNYPEEYPLNIKCIWNIMVPTTNQVVLKFQSFDLERHTFCLHDYIEIRDESTPNSNLIGVYCGQEIPADIISPSNHLRLKFISDTSVHRGRFSVTIMNEYDECITMQHKCEHECVNTLGSYKCACRIGYELHSNGRNCEKVCGGVLNGTKGIVTSPSFPDLYPLNKTCTWEIVAPPKHVIKLNFTNFDLENPTGNSTKNRLCGTDRLEIFSKIGENITKHGVYCGSTVPSPLIIDNNNVVRINFVSDRSIQRTGFALVYLIDDKNKCAVNKGNCFHDCRNTIDSYKCVCSNQFTLQQNGLDCKSSDCKHEISSPNGYISSPFYPNNYPINAVCSWQFMTTPGHRIRISFNTFSLEAHSICNYDNVLLYDGPSIASQNVGKFCGSTIPPMFVSSRNEMYVTFKSDSSNIFKGFQAVYVTICGGVLQATIKEQYIYSHTSFGFLDYDNNTDCQWIIKGPSGYNLSLSFTAFELEDNVNCKYDYLEIFEGLNLSGSSYGKFCGTRKPSDVISSADSLSIRFRSDNSSVSKGFGLIYKAVNLTLLQNSNQNVNPRIF